MQKLGFYSGEEDIEFSSFSSGTERAVKTWQVSCQFLYVFSCFGEKQNYGYKIMLVSKLLVYFMFLAANSFWGIDSHMILLDRPP